MGRKLALAAFGAFALSASAIGVANAASVITDATNAYSVGIGPDGELFDYGSYIGFERLSDSYDPLAPGSPRDSWGVGSSLTGSAYADQADDDTVNITGSTATLGASGGTVTSTTSVSLDVAQKYSFVSPNVLKITETVTNVSAGALPVVFGRDVDWDVSPTEFDENTFGPTGVSPIVIGSSYYGFESPDPQVAYAYSCFVSCNVTSDLGGGIQVSLGTLAAGASSSVNYYYGINEVGQDVNGLIKEAQGDGASYIIATQSSENGAFPSLGENSAFIAVGSAVPEPSTWAMLLVGFAGLGLAAYRRTKTPSAANAPA